MTSRKQVCLAPQTLHYAKFWAQNATETSAGNIPESLSNLFLRDNCRLSQRLLNNAKSLLSLFCRVLSRTFRKNLRKSYGCNGRALDRGTKQEHRANSQKMHKKCPQAGFSDPPDNFWTFFRHFFDNFWTFYRHSLFRGCATISQTVCSRSGNTSKPTSTHIRTTCRTTSEPHAEPRSNRIRTTSETMAKVSGKLVSSRRGCGSRQFREGLMN